MTYSPSNISLMIIVAATIASSVLVSSFCVIKIETVFTDERLLLVATHVCAPISAVIECPESMTFVDSPMPCKLLKRFTKSRSDQ